MNSRNQITTTTNVFFFLLFCFLLSLNLNSVPLSTLDFVSFSLANSLVLMPIHKYAARFSVALPFSLACRILFLIFFCCWMFAVARETPNPLLPRYNHWTAFILFSYTPITDHSRYPPLWIHNRFSPFFAQNDILSSQNIQNTKNTNARLRGKQALLSIYVIVITHRCPTIVHLFFSLSLLFCFFDEFAYWVWYMDICMCLCVSASMHKCVSVCIYDCVRCFVRRKGGIHER